MDRYQFLSQIEKGVASRLVPITAALGTQTPLAGVLVTGRLLRSSLAARICLSDASPRDHNVIGVCVAAEILHTATLCHDDVIDQSPRRRHRPSVWAATSVGGAVLLGDVLLVDALAVIERECPSRVRRLLEVMREIGMAELQVELSPKAAPAARSAWMAYNRSKTGALFAFVSGACGVDAGQVEALEESGYRIGAGYQALDDIVDVCGDAVLSGKPGGRDRARGIQSPAGDDLRGYLDMAFSEWKEALRGLSRWPATQGAVLTFLTTDVLPPFREVLAESPLAEALSAPALLG